MWQLDGTIASLQSPRFSATLDLTRPNQSLHGIRRSDDGGQSTSIPNLWLFGLAPPEGELVLTDCYVRCNDLVATFSETQLRPCLTQVYWRVLDDPEGEGVGVELIISAQTQLLDSLPALSVISIYPNRRPLVLSPQMATFPLADTPKHLLLLAHPSNLERMTSGKGFVSHELFPGDLEKGVIRRARLRGLFVPDDAGGTETGRLYKRFLSSPPPLTT